MAEYNAEVLTDDSEDEKRLENVAQFLEREAAKRRKSVSSKLPSYGAHTLCPLQLLRAQLRRAYRRVTRSRGDQE